MIRLRRPSKVMLGRMAEFWVYGTGPAALLLLLLAPVLLVGRPLPLALTYLALPVYMFHQVEEWDAGLQRRTMGVMGPDQAGLAITRVAIMNVGLVWLPLLAALWLVIQVGPQWSVLAAWMVLVNAALHLGQAAVQWRYNPGLGTAVILFLPLAAAVFYYVPASQTVHTQAFVVVVLLHLLMLAIGRSALRR